MTQHAAKDDNITRLNVVFLDALQQYDPDIKSDDIVITEKIIEDAPPAKEQQKTLDDIALLGLSKYTVDFGRRTDIEFKKPLSNELMTALHQACLALTQHFVAYDSSGKSLSIKSGIYIPVQRIPNADILAHAIDIKLETPGF